MKLCYTTKRFSEHHKSIIRQAQAILEEYKGLGFTQGLTLRQLYYQFVARDLLPNKQKVYKRLGEVIGQARLCGLISWEDIEDRTRYLRGVGHYSDIGDAMKKVADRYRVDMWENQKYRPEVWIEKDALLGVFESVCIELDIPFFSCRGYTSLSEVWRASMRLRGYIKEGKQPLILHFGDHDPSGIDMSRDIFDRLRDTFKTPLEFRRLALTMEQIEEYEPPPNPAKVTDSRYKSYVEKFGDESWELDALDPRQFRLLIEKVWGEICDKPTWDRDKRAEEATIEQIRAVPGLLEEVPKLSKRCQDLSQQLEEEKAEHTACRDRLVEVEKEIGVLKSKRKKPKEK